MRVLTVELNICAYGLHIQRDLNPSHSLPPPKDGGQQRSTAISILFDCKADQHRNHVAAIEQGGELGRFDEVHAVPLGILRTRKDMDERPAVLR